MAAQIVTGVGFLGAGIIRPGLRRPDHGGLHLGDRAIGACAGAGLPILAGVTTGIYLVVAVVYPVITRRLPRSSTAISVMRVRYPDGRGILRRLLQVATDLGFAIDQLSTESFGYSVRTAARRSTAAGAATRSR